MTRTEPVAGHTDQVNPFEVTKAVDFTDREIYSMWVDWPAPGGFAEFMTIKSPMARIITGGKGTGRTHIMRHFSAPLQVIRGGETPSILQVVEDGVLGVYVRCSGLNSSRFRGRGLSDDAWQFIFAQYMDVWLAQVVLETFNTVFEEQVASVENEGDIARDICELLDVSDLSSPSSLTDLCDYLFDLQRKIDLAVNNAALNPSATLDVSILSSPGKLVFGIPDILKRHFNVLQGITFLYLIDEFENFDIPQQRYVNSLVRESPLGTSFMVGVRTYGLRTFETLNDGEENKHGSEFEEIRPERSYTATSKIYEEFCQKIVARRLSEYSLFDDNQTDKLNSRLDEFFVLPSDDHEEQLVINRYGCDERPYMVRLRRQLREYARDTKGMLLDSKHIDMIINAACVSSRPLLEKANILRIYRAWADGDDLVETAQNMVDSRCSDVSVDEVKPNCEQQLILNYFATDLKAQLCHDMQRDPIYAGLDQFIRLSDGLPRNLLVILKYIFRWARFSEENPFRGGKISLNSQRRGLLDATDWFLADAKPLGKDGEDLLAAIGKLCNMFRQFRFSDKPVESSLTGFSADLTRCSQRAREMVDLAERWSLLIRVEGGQKNRTTGLIEPKFRLNRLVSPRWDLPIALRGAVSLRDEEVNAIFDPDYTDNFTTVLNQRLVRMNVPFGRGRPDGSFQQAFKLES